MGAGVHGGLMESAHVHAAVASRKQSENVTDHSKFFTTPRYFCNRLSSNICQMLKS